MQTKAFSQSQRVVSGAADSKGAADSNPLIGKDANWNWHYPGVADSDLPVKRDADRNRHHLPS